MSEVVLIVDDDPVQRRLLETMIQRFGYQTIVADGGDAAVKLFTRPDTRDRCRGPRPGHARSRWAWRSGLHARGQPQYSGDRADRPRRHRQCRVGHARGRDRLRGEAGKPRKAGSLAAQRARGESARGRTATAQTPPRRHADHCRRDHTFGGDAAGSQGRGKGGRLCHIGADSKANPASARN